MEVADNIDRHQVSFSPPFPHDVPTTPLLRLSLRKLLDDDKKESDRFFRAYTDLGFFYLELGGALHGR